jgi:hypothetical protein
MDCEMIIAVRRIVRHIDAQQNRASVRAHIKSVWIARAKLRGMHT